VRNGLYHHGKVVKIQLQGNFHGVFDHTSSYPQNLLKRGKVVKFRGPWTGLLFNKDSPLNPNMSYTHNNEMVVAFSNNLDNTSVPWKITLNLFEELERSVWGENDKKWKVLLELPKDICHAYNICNAYGSCNLVTSHTCTCLDVTRFVPSMGDSRLVGWLCEVNTIGL